ncbi:MAG: ubiquinone/menaquinone biosynthesis methyltransferase [Candidatus Bipolaricaulia bacterium]
MSGNTEHKSPDETDENHEKVKKIFTDIARDYDRVNKVISFGQIDRWRKRLISRMVLPKDGSILDLGCGTGKLTRLIAERMGAGKVVGVDLTPGMIEIATDTLPGEYKSLVDFRLGVGEDLDFQSNSFDLATSAFTLRNVNDLEKVITEMRRVVKPGGRVYSLELAKPGIPVFGALYRFYFRKLLPVIGGLAQGDKGPYRYLVESLKRFPNQEGLKQLYEKAGLVEVEYEEIFGGVAAIHQGIKRG